MQIVVGERGNGDRGRDRGYAYDLAMIYDSPHSRGWAWVGPRALLHVVVVDAYRVCRTLWSRAALD